MKRFKQKLIVGAAMICGAALSLPAVAEIDLAGKTVEFVIPFSEKGGSAKWANFFAPLMSQALPGNPTVIVKYMPGAGSTKGANWFQKQKNGDGTLVFGTSGSTHFPYLLGDPRVKYEIKDWIPVMATGTGGVAYINAKDGKKFDGSGNTLKGSKHIFGSQGATRLDLIPLLAWKMLGMKVEPVFGIKSRGNGRLMFERGEATIDYQTTAAYLQASMPLVEEGKAVPMMTWGSLDDDGKVIRDPTFPKLPTFKEVCEKTDGCSTSGDAWNAWKSFFSAGFPVQKIVFLPAGTDQAIVETYVKAFEKIRARPDFKKLSSKRLGEYPMLVGKQAASATVEATTVTPSAKAFVIKWLNADYGTKLK